MTKRTAVKTVDTVDVVLHAKGRRTVDDSGTYLTIELGYPAQTSGQLNVEAGISHTVRVYFGSIDSPSTNHAYWINMGKRGSAVHYNCDSTAASDLLRRMAMESTAQITKREAQRQEEIATAITQQMKAALRTSPRRRRAHGR